MGRANFADLPTDLQNNLLELQARTTAFFKAFEGPLYVSSGYRPASINAKIGGAKQSLHQICAAVDVRDSGDVWAYCLKNLPLAADLGLWLEDKRWTTVGPSTVKGWAHLQIHPPKSGNRIFVPNASPAINPAAWAGIYDKSLDGLAPRQAKKKP